MTPLTCPRCGSPLAPDASYGPCPDCRAQLLANAARDAANRVPPAEPIEVPRQTATAPKAPEVLPDPDAFCAHCSGGVYGPQAHTEPPAHECCAFWIGERGYDSCPSCTVAKRGKRLGEPLQIPRTPPARPTVRRSA